MRLIAHGRKLVLDILLFTTSFWWLNNKTHSSCIRYWLRKNTNIWNNEIITSNHVWRLNFIHSISVSISCYHQSWIMQTMILSSIEVFDIPIIHLCILIIIWVYLILFWCWHFLPWVITLFPCLLNIASSVRSWWRWRIGFAIHIISELATFCSHVLIIGHLWILTKLQGVLLIYLHLSKLFVCWTHGLLNDESSLIVWVLSKSCRIHLTSDSSRIDLLFLNHWIKHSIVVLNKRSVIFANHTSVTKIWIILWSYYLLLHSVRHWLIGLSQIGILYWVWHTNISKWSSIAGNIIQGVW